MYIRLRFFIPFLLAGLSFAQQPNILNNGGFEYGLMCYSYYIWNQTIFGPSDYRLMLSSDAHSGNSSLEIRCGGSDCIRAGITSNKIPAQPNQTYTLKTYAKCPAGTPALAGFYVPGTATGDAFGPLTCNGAWTQSQLTFTTASTATDFYFYLLHYDFGAGPQSLLLDDVTLTYGDGTAPSEVVLHSGIRNVQISGNTVMVDGAPYLALGFFDVNYNDMGLAASKGANTVFGLGSNSNANCFNTGGMSYLDHVYESGLNFVPDSSYAAKMGNSVSAFPGITQRFAPHLANIAWMLADEPDQTYATWWEIPAPTFVAEHDAAKTQTSLPMLANMQRASDGMTSEVTPYVNGVDLWMAEPYGPDFSLLNHATSMLLSLKQAPLWLAEDDIDANLIVPKAYWAIVNGATGIIYFNWDAFKADSSKMAAAQQAFAELGQLKNTLFSQNINGLVTAPPGIAFQARYNGGAAYILAANSTSQTVPAQFNLAGLTAGQTIQVLFENRTITSSAGSFTDTFTGPSRHVYSLTAPLVSFSGSLGTKSGPDNPRDWKVLVTNSGIGTAVGASVSNMVFTQTGGKTCSATPVGLPFALGDIGPGASVTGDTFINFSGCDTTSKFTVAITVSANNGSATGTILRNNERK